MKILVGEDWADGFLDPWCGPRDVRITVKCWQNVEQLDDLYFEREPSFRTLIDYGREVGPVEVARKVLSRLSEGARNQKYAAIGLGEVIDGAGFEPGETVAFFAPCVPRCVERVVLVPELVWPVDEQLPEEDLQFSERLSDRFRTWSAWRPESGAGLVDIDTLAERVFECLTTAVADRTLPLDPPSAVVERQLASPVRSTQGLSACLLGFGHYARTIILPSVPAGIDVQAVHELDPLMAPDDFTLVDTAPDLRDDEHYDVVFVAGYHASHARIAAQALERGAWVVSEKPLATTHNGLRMLRDVFGESSRYFAGFHRRYSTVNDWIFADLRPTDNNPLSYHSIVHEVELPARHWYQWPASGSRLLSNGCHWVDHFLFLNGFAEVARSDVRRGPHGTIVCTMELVNGAFFSLTLTDRGSDRLGVREHTEIRVKDATVRIDDFKEYEAEGPNGLIRREKFHKLAAHRAMYASIGARILNGSAGDTLDSVQRSSLAVLDLEEQLGA